MKNILIVDDNKTNRMIMTAYIESFIEEDKLNATIYEANDGDEAVSIAKEKEIDIIFMDIMMPNKDGIEATREIRTFDKKVMIIAVSALDDDANKQKIINAGAEDYIVKPVNQDVLKKRLSQYKTIINFRNQKKLSIDPVNLISSAVYSRRCIFLVSDDNSLAEFWDFWLSRTKENDEIVELVRILYGFGAWQLKLKYKFEIILEEDDQNQYFTMTNMKLLNTQIIEKIINRNYPQGIYKLEGDKLSLKISKFKNAIDRPSVKQVENQEQNVQEISTIAPIKTIEQHEDELLIFDFIEEDDRAELDSIASELQSMMLIVGSSKLEAGEIVAIAQYIEKFSKILSQYPETYNLYLAINTLAQDILENTDSFMEKSKDIATLCIAFNNDLIVWIKKLFIEGAPSVDFLDNSIISNANMISSFIKPNNPQAESLDDIFDF